jgi:hypothetical protein
LLADHAIARSVSLPLNSGIANGILAFPVLSTATMSDEAETVAAALRLLETPSGCAEFAVLPISVAGKIPADRPDGVMMRP